MAKVLLANACDAVSAVELVRMDTGDGSRVHIPASAQGTHSRLCVCLLDVDVHSPRLARGELLTPLAHRQPESPLEHHLKVRNVREPADARDFRD